VLGIPVGIYYFAARTEIDWKRMGRGLLKYGPIFIVYLLITTFLYEKDIIEFHWFGGILNFFSLILLYYGIKLIIKKDTDTGVLLTVMGLGFLSIYLTDILNYSYSRGDLATIIRNINDALQILGGLVLISAPLLIVAVIILL